MCPRGYFKCPQEEVCTQDVNFISVYGSFPSRVVDLGKYCESVDPRSTFVFEEVSLMFGQRDACCAVTGNFRDRKTGSIDYCCSSSVCGTNGAEFFCRGI